MSDFPEEFQFLWREYKGGLDLTDDRALIDWLYRVFHVARTYTMKIPFRMEVARRIWPRVMAIREEVLEERAAETRLLLNECCEVLSSEHPIWEFTYDMAEKLAYWLRS